MFVCMYGCTCAPFSNALSAVRPKGAYTKTTIRQKRPKGAYTIIIIYII